MENGSPSEIRVKLSAMIKAWAQEYPLDFEIIIFDVGWSLRQNQSFSRIKVSFSRIKVSRVSLEDKADFEEGGIVTGPNIARGFKILGLPKSSPRITSLRKI